MDFQNFMNPNALPAQPAPSVQDQIAAAYEAGDINTVNNLITSANMTADQANNIWGSGIAALAQQQGVNFAPTTPQLTTDVAKDLMWRSMTTGVPTSEYDKYGGYDAVQKAYTDAGGAYGREEIPFELRQQYANEMQQTGQGNLGLLVDMGLALPPSAIEQLRTAGVPENVLAGLQQEDPVKKAKYEQEKYQYDLSSQADTLASNINNVYTDNQVSLNEAQQVQNYLNNYNFKPEDISKATGIPLEKIALLIAAKDSTEDEFKDYVKDYQLKSQADPMKAGIANLLADNQISLEEANQIKAYQDNYGFNAADISRVTGQPLDVINQIIGARGSILGQGYTANAGNALGLADYAVNNKLSAKDLSSASGGALTEEDAQSLISKAGTTAGRLELTNPEAHSKIQGIISRAVNHDYGGKEADWMYKMFTGLSADEVSQAPAQLELTPPKKETRVVGGDEGGYQTEEVIVPGSVKEIPGLRVVETDEYGRPTKYVKEIDSKDFNLKPGEQTHTGTQGLVAEYDGTGKLTGYSSGNRIYTSDPNWIGAKWNPDGTSSAYGGYTGGGGFIKGLGNDVAGFTESLGPIWTAAKIAFPELNLVDVGADVARSEVDLNTGVKAAVGTAGYLDADAANAVNGLDGGNAVVNTAQLNTANNLRLGAAGASAIQAADSGNYAPLLNVAANISGANQMPGVSTALNTVSAINAVNNGDMTSLLGAAGNLTGSSDLKLASAANRFIDAVNSGNQNSIVYAASVLGGAASTNAQTSGAVKTLKDLVNGVKNDVVKTLNTAGLEEKNPAATPDGFYDPNFVSGVLDDYKKATGPTVTGTQVADITQANQERLNDLDPGSPYFNKSFNQIIEDEIALGDKGHMRLNVDGTYTNTNGTYWYKNSNGDWNMTNVKDEAVAGVGKDDTTSGPSGSEDGTGTDTVTKGFWDKFGTVLGLGTSDPTAEKIALIGGGASNNTGGDFTLFSTDGDKAQAIIWMENKVNDINDDPESTQVDRDKAEEILQKVKDTKVGDAVKSTTTSKTTSTAGGGGGGGGGGSGDSSDTLAGAIAGTGGGSSATSVNPADIGTGINVGNVSGTGTGANSGASTSAGTAVNIGTGTGTGTGDGSGVGSGSGSGTGTGTGTGTGSGTGSGSGSGTGSGTGTGTGSGSGSGDGSGTDTTTETKIDTKKDTKTTTPNTPITPTTTAKSTGLNFGQVQQALAAAGIPQLANVFYYGKDFGGKKQKLDKKGELINEEYDPLSVTKAGAMGEIEEQVAEDAKTKENDVNTALDHILGKSSESTSLDDLLNIVKGA